MYFARPMATAQCALLITTFAMTAGLVPSIAAAQQLPPCGNFSGICFDIDGTVEDADNSGVDALSATPPGPEALITLDPPTSGNKELGPINGTNTKVGKIHDAAPPLLGFTSLNQSTDLTKIFTQTAIDASGDIWYYFGYHRKSDNGAAFISIEFQKSEAPDECDYSLASATIIATCNPWANRAAGDFLILFDGNGGFQTIIQRIFDEDANGNVFLPACPSQWPNNLSVQDTDFCIRLAASNAFATYGSGGFTKGEMALNLTDIIFGEDGAPQCLSLANILPNTVTGNSDTADYKDTVLRNFDPIRNCGTVTITKVTVPAGLDDEFTYRLVNSVSGEQVFDGAVDAECTVSGTSKDECAGLLKDGDTDTIDNVLGGLYSLSEDANADFTATIVCTFDGETYSDDDPDADNPFPFPVEALATTECVITNSFNKTTPTATSTQLARIFDYLVINDIQPNAPDKGDARVTIYLFPGTSANCAVADALGKTAALSLTYQDADGNPGGPVKAELNTVDSALTAEPNKVLTFGSPAGSWKWAFSYTGDALNNGITTTQTCGWESGTVSFSETAFPAP